LLGVSGCTETHHAAQAKDTNKPQAQIRGK